MKRFELGQKVKVTDREHPLDGQTGVVTRLLMRNRSAWVQMDAPLPAHLASFPKADHRRDHIILWPDECEKATQ